MANRLYNKQVSPKGYKMGGKVMGDRVISIDSNGKMTETGDYVNNSKYIYVECVEEGSFPISAAPFGHAEYLNPVAVAGSSTGAENDIVPPATFRTTSDSNTASSKLNFAGIDVETATTKIDNKNYLAPIPNNSGTGSNSIFAFDSTLSYEMTGSSAVDIAKRQFTIGFQSGFDGCSPTVRKQLGSNISAGNSQGYDLSSNTAAGTLAYRKAINAVSNPDEFDINMLVLPGVIHRLHSSVSTFAKDMCEDRQDTFFVMDASAWSDSISTAVNAVQAFDSNYVASYYPWVKIIDPATNRIVPYPPSALMMAVFASNDQRSAEWFAPAGLNRGGIESAVSVMDRLNFAERDTLYEGKVNPIAAFPGQGIVAFGQKTLQRNASALDRINVRRLLINLKKFIASSARFLIFEQNVTATRNRFLGIVNPYLENVQQRLGLYAFRVIMDDSNNTPEMVDRNIMYGQIFIQPARSVEYIVLDFNVQSTGATFGA